MSTEVETRSAQMESSQALKTALELSMLNLSSNACSPPSMGGMMSENGDINAMIEDDSCMLPKVPRSQNVTHCVAVPSSEHVAEIVGRQGCKIKALRAKTNTYIKTPVRGEDPVFIITGRPEDVSAAKREVLAAADHFTQIRAAKNAHSNGSRQSPTARSSPDCQEKVTVYVKVPYRVVGLVVGPKGATIKRIQQITNTHIVTPSRDKEPCFEVSGKPEEVEKAKREIESYIAMRTGGCHGDSDNDSDYGSLMSPPMDCIFSPNTRKMSDTTSNRVIPQFSPRSSTSPPSSTTAIYGVDTLDGGFCLPSAWGGAEPSTRSPLSSAVFNCSRVGRSQSFNESTLMNDNPPPLSAPIYPMTTVFDFADFRDFGKDDSPSPTTSSSASSEAISSPKSSPQLSMFRRNSCCVCKEKDVVAALVPCGHNLFCAGCACTSVNERCCPVCSSHVTSMLRVYSN